MNDELTTVHDHELATAVRESLAGVHMNIPLETIVSHGRNVRARRRVPGLAGALGVLAAAAVVVSALLTAGHPPAMQLAAWTVVRHSDGTVKVTIHQLRDPAGLQRTLRADGIPANVTFFWHANPACQGYPPENSRLIPPRVPPLLNKVIQYREYGRSDVLILLHPSALPNHVGVEILVGHIPLGGQVGLSVAAGLVQTSPRCTGS